MTQYYSEYQTLTWLDCDMRVEAGVKVVTKLKCQVCTKFGERILGRRNFSDKCIQGTDSVQTTSIFDHAKSNQHVHVACDELPRG